LTGNPEPSHRDRALAIVGSAHGSNGNFDILIARQQLSVLLFDQFGGFGRKAITRRSSNDLRSRQPEQFFGGLVDENITQVARIPGEIGRNSSDPSDLRHRAGSGTRDCLHNRTRSLADLLES
jgi:hypothetical protein